MAEQASGKKVVVSDDDSTYNELLQYLLRAAGHSVFPAKDGEEAIRVVLGERPDLLLLDLHLPIKDGFAVMEELRRHPSLNGIQILVISASENQREIERARTLGATDFVIKPFDCEALVRKVEGLLKKEAPAKQAPGPGTAPPAAEPVSPALDAAPQKPFDPAKATLGQILVELGVLTKEQLAEALARCDPQQRRLPEVVISMGLTTEEKMLKAVSVRQTIPYFAAFEGFLDPQAGRLVPERTAREYLVAPIRQLPQGLLLGMVNALDIVAIDTVAALTGLRVLPVLTTRANLFDTITRLYAPGPEAAVMAGGEPKEASGRPEAASPPSGEAASSSAEISIIDTVNSMLAEAIEDGASDIHLEPAERSVRVRYRVDGLLQDRKTFPKEFHTALVARIKILSRLDITETRLPQDGHIRHQHKKRGVDLRISTLPSLFGEKVVVRILDHSKGIRRLSELGMPPGIDATLAKLIGRPTGLLLVTGPTGSGKTTTLYAALNEINTQEKNIVTLEDPIEYHLEGITQTEAVPRIGLSFAVGLRSILRQDPNVILVGEIRDLETAEIAVQAAVTGHLVLSTLHTRDAVGTVARLLNMKIQPFLLAAALSGVLAQRLVRVLCAKCKREAPPGPQELAWLGMSPEPGRRFCVPFGCESCFNTGYTGRVAIYEWMEVNEDIRNWIFSGTSTDEMRRALKSKGMRSLQEDGLEKADQGITSLAEVLRVTQEERG